MSEGPVAPAELLSYADSPFAKKKADLLILGYDDGSGETVAARREAIADEQQHVEYRLVPRQVLIRAATTIETQAEAYGELLSRLVAWQNATPREFWPREVRDAVELIEAAAEKAAAERGEG